MIWRGSNESRCRRQKLTTAPGAAPNVPAGHDPYGALRQRDFPVFQGGIITLCSAALEGIKPMVYVIRSVAVQCVPHKQ
jgi:hypothetical protein